MADAIILGMMLMYALAGAYIGWMLPVKRRGMSVVLCTLIWPIMLMNVDFKTKEHRF